MQRKNLLKEELKQRYFQPVIDSLKKSDLTAAKFIKTVFSFLQMKYADKFMTFFRATTNDIHGEVRHRFEKELSSCPGLKQPLINLFSLYLDETRREVEFPGIDVAEIHTYIRELFHDFINPIPIINIQTFTTVSISKNGDRSKQDNKLFTIPADVQRIIHSQLGHEGALPFKRTCKSAYFFHKNIQDKPVNIFYMLACDVQITRKKSFLESDLDIALKKSVTEQEITSSLHQYNKSDVKLFPSLFQALEYAEHLQHGGHMDDDETEGYIPSLWLVAYIGNADNLQFSQEKITLNNGCSSSAYDGNQRELMASYAVVPPNAVQPLIGIVAYSYSDFASYKIFNVVNYLTPEKTNISSICAVM